MAGQRLDLPFVRRRGDVASAVWRHRAGIYALVAAIFVVAAVFVGSRITILTPSDPAGILLDLRTLEELQRQAARLENEIAMRRASDDGLVQNIASNQAAQSQQTNALRSSAAANMSAQMAANRDIYEEGMRRIAEVRAGAGGVSDGDKGTDNGRETGEGARAKGRVLVSYNIPDPVRTAAFLEVPGYRCEGGGEVVVEVVVDGSGAVVSATVNRAISTADGCMTSTAVGAARRSRFRPSADAPDRQRGTITYSFIPQ